MVAQNLVRWPKQLAQEYIAKGYWRGITIGEVLDSVANKYPEKVAVIDEKERVTYRQLVARVNRIALGLLAAGLKKGDRVIVQLPNWVESVYFLLALIKLGALGVMILRQFRAREVASLANMSGAVGIVIPQSYRDFDYVHMVEQLREEVPSLNYIIVVGGEGQRGTIPLSDLLQQPWEERYAPNYLDQLRSAADEIAFLVTTGGTTTFPKLVPYTHNSFLCWVSCFREARNINPDSVYLLNQPISHGGAQARLFAVLGCGATFILHSRIEPEEILGLIQREKVTNMQIVPTTAFDIINYPELHRYNVGSLNVIECGASHLAPELARNMIAKLCPNLINSYGTTEGVGFNTRLGDPLEVVCHTVGRPLCPADEVKIVDDRGETVPLGQEGEVLFRGPDMTIAYYNNPDETRKSFDSDCFFHTGDMAVLDEAGNLRLIGRKKDMILRGAENISPLEIEGLLLQHPKVAGVAVIGIPDPRLGEKACACIKPRPGADISFEEMTTFLKNNGLASFKLPERLELIEEFPLTAMSKIYKKGLKEQIISKLKTEGNM